MRTTKARSGFSIIELLIAIIIIGILVAVIVPVLLNRAEEARVAAANSDIEHLRGAQERAAIDTQYLYRFYVLDDVIGGDGLFNLMAEGDVDGVRDEEINITVQNPTNMFINRKTGLFYLSTYADIYDRLTANETSFGWNGPYVNFHRMRDFDRNDLPEDPWGNEYQMFTSEGRVNQYLGIIESFYNFSPIDAPLTSMTLVIPFFDRPTILSWGENGLPGDGTINARIGTDDDIYQQF